MFLLFHGRFPGEKAASLFTAKNAEAFAKAGLQVKVLVPRRKDVEPQTAFDYYAISKNFEIVELPTTDFFALKIPKRLAFLVSFIAFSLACFYYLRRQSPDKDDLAYSNESLPLWAASFAGLSTFYEMHDFPESKLGLFGLLLKRFDWILIHNRWKVQEFKKIFPKIKAKILCEPNAVDIKEFDIQISKEEARDRLGLDAGNRGKQIAVYTGHLFGWKGVDTLAKAAEILGNDCLVIFVGGTEKDVIAFKKKYGQVPNILIVGHKLHKEIPIWQKAADVLILPNTAKEAISTFYTSPMKLYEYMASRRPIVASDIPSVREIVDETCAVLVKPDEPEVLAIAIRSVLERSDLSNTKLIDMAMSRAHLRTWDRRADNIIAFMKNNAQ